MPSKKRKLVYCPNCRTSLIKQFQSLDEGEELSFCLKCRFPLMLVAGKYRFHRLIAEGGFGTLYLAIHEGLERDPERVIKILKPEVFKIPNMLQRFQREVQLTSSLSQLNEHIVRIYDDFGEIPNLGHFYVMEYLDGYPLTKLLRQSQKPLSLNLIMHIFYQLCDAMIAAHNEGIVHRDLKPDNLFIVHRQQVRYFLKVLDFGIAKPLDNEMFQSNPITQSTLGTPLYMSPEQCSGQKIDHRADIYSMGIILYEMLTGQTPFYQQASTGQLYSIFQAHLSEEPEPPSSRRPELDIPQELDDIVLKCLAKSPEERFFSVNELQMALQQLFPPLLSSENSHYFFSSSPSHDALPLLAQQTPNALDYFHFYEEQFAETQTFSDDFEKNEKKSLPTPNKGKLLSPSSDSLVAIDSKMARKFVPKEKEHSSFYDKGEDSDELDLSFTQYHSSLKSLPRLIIFLLLFGMLSLFIFRRMQKIYIQHHKKVPLALCGQGAKPSKEQFNIIIFPLQKIFVRESTPASVTLQKRIFPSPLNRELERLLREDLSFLEPSMLNIHQSPVDIDIPDPKMNHLIASHKARRCKMDLAISATHLQSFRSAHSDSSSPSQNVSSWIRLFVSYVGQNPSIRIFQNENRLPAFQNFDLLIPLHPSKRQWQKLISFIKGLILFKIAGQIQRNDFISFLLYRKAAHELKKVGYTSLYVYLQEIKSLSSRKLTPRKRPQIWIPEGKFYFGEKKKRKLVFLKGYWIDRFEVNRENYARCVLKGKCMPIKDFLKGDWELPRDRITFKQAQIYCQFEGKKLPSEEQWVKAGRGGLMLNGHKNPYPTRRYPWGNQKPTCQLSNNNWCYQKNIDGDKLPIQLPVSTKIGDVSPYGVFHLIGNVSELLKNGKIKGGSGFSVARSLDWKADMDQRRGLSWVGFRCVKEKK